MPSFDSPLGNNKFEGTSLREFNVPDESSLEENTVNPIFRRKESLDENSLRNFQNRFQEEPEEIEREFKEARKAKFGKERLNDGAKRRLEMLLNMTKTVHEVNINGNIFILQTIPSKSIRECLMAASEYDGTVQAPFEARRQFLARSITQIAGVEFDQFVGSESIDAKLAFIDEMDEALLNRLYSEYYVMQDNAKNKYAVKNESDAKEIVDNLKK